MADGTKRAHGGEGYPLVADAVEAYRCECCGRTTVLLRAGGEPIAWARFADDIQGIEFLHQLADSLEVRAN